MCFSTVFTKKEKIVENFCDTIICVVHQVFLFTSERRLQDSVYL